MTLKDSLDTEGVISTWGTLGRKGYVPDKDAVLVSRLRREGAILLGKTNTPELTLAADTNNLIYGRTANWQPLVVREHLQLKNKQEGYYYDDNRRNF